jgi:Family of unknown function (DUF6328)
MVEDESAGKLDRELDELLQELRVALPGVQVLFAFLLTIPFAHGSRSSVERRSRPTSSRSSRPPPPQRC